METKDNFYDRVFINFNRDKVIVWPTAKEKLDRFSKVRLEMWNIQTAQNYVRILEENDN